MYANEGKWYDVLSEYRANRGPAGGFMPAVTLLQNGTVHYLDRRELSLAR